MTDPRLHLLDPEAAGVFRAACRRFLSACRNWTDAQTDAWVDAQLAMWGDSAVFYNEPPALSLAGAIVEMERGALATDQERTVLRGEMYDCMEAHRHWNLFTNEAETAAICKAVESAVDVWRRGL